LQEELGITAGEWTDIGPCDPFTTIVVSPTRLFLARKLAFGTPNLEGTEHTQMRKVPFDVAVEMVFDGRITHGPSCVLILKTQRILAQ